MSTVTTETTTDADLDEMTLLRERLAQLEERMTARREPPIPQPLVECMTCGVPVEAKALFGHLGSRRCASIAAARARSAAQSVEVEQ